MLLFKTNAAAQNLKVSSVANRFNLTYVLFKFVKCK